MTEAITESDTCVEDTVDPTIDEELVEPKKKKIKGKKRPSDFEIVRTILTRTHERKLPYLLKDMGEDSDILFTCSCNEENFTYGSPDLAIVIIEFTDPELRDMTNTVLHKLHGMQPENVHQRIVNLRDQFSELAKTKGETLDNEVKHNDAGAVWVVRTDTAGKERIVQFSSPVDSLFHVQMVKNWCQSYRPLLTTDDAKYLYFPYQHQNTNTASIVTLPLPAGSNHPLAQFYPHGFRFLVTRGIDVLIDKFLLDPFPYPVISQDIIVFQNQSVSVQVAHRIQAQGWRMVLIRPNAVFFPTVNIPIPSVGQHSL